MFPDVPALSAIFVLPCIPTSNHYVIILVIILEIILCLTVKKMLIIPPNAWTMQVNKKATACEVFSTTALLHLLLTLMLFCFLKKDLKC